MSQTEQEIVQSVLSQDQCQQLPVASQDLKCYEELNVPSTTPEIQQETALMQAEQQHEEEAPIQIVADEEMKAGEDTLPVINNTVIVNDGNEVMDEALVEEKKKRQSAQPKTKVIKKGKAAAVAKKNRGAGTSMYANQKKQQVEQRSNGIKKKPVQRSNAGGSAKATAAKARTGPINGGGVTVAPRSLAQSQAGNIGTAGGLAQANPSYQILNLKQLIQDGIKTHLTETFGSGGGILIDASALASTNKQLPTSNDNLRWGAGRVDDSSQRSQSILERTILRHRDGNQAQGSPSIATPMNSGGSFGGTVGANSNQIRAPYTRF